jgi:hypothetical protein
MEVYGETGELFKLYVYSTYYIYKYMIYCIYGRGKGSPYNRPRGPKRGNRGIALPFREPRHEEGMGWLAPRPGRLTPGKETRYPLLIYICVVLNIFQCCLRRNFRRFMYYLTVNVYDIRCRVHLYGFSNFIMFWHLSCDTVCNVPS